MRRTPERKVLGDLGNTKAEPVSPTANLRLLTSLASSLKSAVDSSSQTRSTSRKVRTPLSANSESLKLLPRKQKSLGLLCDKFLSLYPLEKLEGSMCQEISLDGTAKTLGTEKRRIYDIINVLESLEMATKAGKNRYLWHGQKNLVSTLIKFKSLAIKLGLKEQIQEIQKINKAYIGDNCDDYSSTSSTDGSMVYDETNQDMSFDTDIREDKSLGAMCQKFVMLFLISLKNGVINLDIAAKVLITDIDNGASGSAAGNVGSRFKTKVRRLYDIANVLTAIGLIKKIYMYDRTLRKPVFKYIGPDVEYVDVNRETPVREQYHSFVDMMTPSKSCNISEMRIPEPSLQSTIINSITRHKDLTVGANGTPVIDKKKPRKRKLFVGDSSFTRTHSSPCFETKSRSLERLDDSILRVAEMELEKLISSEEAKPKACTKLFSRYNSDSCIVTNHPSNHDLDDNGLVANNVNEVKNDGIGNSLNNAPFVIVSKQNLITRYANESPIDFLQTSTPIRAPLDVKSTIKQTTPVRTICRSIDRNSVTRILPAMSLSAPSVGTPTTRKLIPFNGSEGSSIDGRKFARVSHYKIEPKNKAPKIISLTNFDPKKLIPIKRSDLKISLMPVNPIVLDNRSGTPGFAILTRIPAPIVSPGDTFKAVKVGNTLQLVPIKNDDSCTSSKCDIGDNSGNAS